MKVAFTFASLALLSGFQAASAHCAVDRLPVLTVRVFNNNETDIWTTLVAGDTVSNAAVRQPQSNSPVLDVTSDDITCNVSPADATATVSALLRFTWARLLRTAADWDGSGANWFKIAEWGAEFEPSFAFIDYGASALNATIPSSVPAGEYLARIEQIGLHSTGAPQWYISCAQISITDGGSASPDMVEIPGYVDADDAWTHRIANPLADIYYPTPTAYTVPGPTVFSG
ncbi:glycoside hydrolase family 61 protein [Armillaria novae-zelandiae]|uniref:AA9 family lytic polysaccharide monooxygenase n=1 Tax=Armillaria novae-zelandiae TaxID=153914 RepID=A0AA39NVC8_9AGAR|nr:glycoside hydrolase family 61 protein [Armillaria novae-zelandiae]